jgi:hypothetical protein
MTIYDMNMNDWMNMAEANLEVVDSQVVISDFRTSNSPTGYSHICPATLLKPDACCANWVVLLCYMNP